MAKKGELHKLIPCEYTVKKSVVPNTHGCNPENSLHCDDAVIEYLKHSSEVSINSLNYE